MHGHHTWGTILFWKSTAAPRRSAVSAVAAGNASSCGASGVCIGDVHMLTTYMFKTFPSRYV